MVHQKINLISMVKDALSQPAFTCSKLTIETLEQGVKYVNFEHISHLVLVFLLLTLNMQLPAWIMSLVWYTNTDLFHITCFKQHKDMAVERTLG